MGCLNVLNEVVELNVVWEDIDIDFAAKSVSWSSMAQDQLLISLSDERKERRSLIDSNLNCLSGLPLNLSPNEVISCLLN